MGNTKTVFRYFSVSQYCDEEVFLSEMHEKGWKLIKASYPGFYHFEKCEPGQVTYRLDYNQEGIRNKEEYVQMFADCGWEHICEFAGYSYFRKAGEAGEDKEEIFCDDASRLDMMNRVFVGKIVPLIIVFLCIILPQLALNTFAHGGSSVVHDIFSVIFVVLAAIYLTMFTMSAVQFYQYEKKVSGDSKKIRLKYIAIFAFIAVMVVTIGMFFWIGRRQVYTVTDRDDGFIVQAERLNSAVVREYDLKSGDTVVFNIRYDGGCVHLKLAKDGSDPSFFCDFYASGEHEITITDDGHYKAEVSGARADADVTVTIR